MSSIIMLLRYQYDFLYLCVQQRMCLGSKGEYLIRPIPVQVRYGQLVSLRYWITHVNLMSVNLFDDLTLVHTYAIPTCMLNQPHFAALFSNSRFAKQDSSHDAYT